MSNSKITITPETRVIRDEAEHIRSIFEFGGIPPLEPRFDPQEVANKILEENRELFEWPTAHSELKQTSLHESSHAYSVGFTQEFKGVPVDASEVTANITKDGQPYSVYNNYHYEIPEDLDPGAIEIDARQVQQRIAKYFKGRYESHEIMGEPRLLIYRHWVEPAEPEGYVPKRLPPKLEGLELVGEEGVYYVAWEVMVETTGPSRLWRVLIDARTGSYIDVKDMFQYFDGSGKVFDPDPIATSGDTSLTILGSSPTSNTTLDKQAGKVTLKDLKKDASGKYHLDGSYVRMEEIEPPTIAEPTDTAGKFEFSRADDGFKDTMAYYHIDRFQRYLQQLGFSKVVNFDIPVDALGENGFDNSHYDDKKKQLVFGAVTSTGVIHVADAEDAGVILHEYGHAIQDSQKPGMYSYDGVSEGFGDFLPAVYFHDKHAKPANTVGMTFPWDGHSGQANYTARRYDRPWKFGGPEATGNYTKGELWASVMFEIYRKLGGDSSWLGDKHTARDLMIKLHLEANISVSNTNPSPTQMAQEIEKADKKLKGWQSHKDGLHTKVIYDAFHFRELTGYKEKLTPTSNVDVYIDDGRKGKYDWLQDPWHPKDIWSRLKQDGTQPGNDTHQEPFQNKPAYLYVKVRNRGTEKANKVTVKAYHSAPAVGLVYPDHFTAMKPASIDVTDLLPDSQNPNGTIVGPFEWTPTASSGGCVLVILECGEDQALTQTLTGSVNTIHLARFDNNIAQRNLSPVPNSGSPKRAFLLANPDEEVRHVDLQITSTLPDVWEAHYSLPELRGIRLGPLERRWVEFEVTIPPGSEVVNLENPPRLSFEGLIEERSIGGIDFYFAPPETFGWPREEARPVEVRPRDLFDLHIPWDECDVEGTLELKLNFKKRT